MEGSWADATDGIIEKKIETPPTKPKTNNPRGKKTKSRERVVGMSDWRRGLV